jgi:hypothetical protein
VILKPVYGYALALLIGASGSWYVQGLRWGNDVQARDLIMSEAMRKNVEVVNRQLITSRDLTEKIRADFLTYKAEKEDETSALERAVADGAKRLSIRARCPTVPATGAVPGGAVSGTAELEPAAERVYFALKRGADRQFADLQFCRSELKKRSSN